MFLNEEVLANYVDVYIHCEGNAIVNGHMVILAQQSPYLHKFFQSRKNMKVADLFYTNIKHSGIKNAIRILYGKLVSVPDFNLKRVCSFLTMIQVDFEVISKEEDIFPTQNAESNESVVFQNQEKVQSTRISTEIDISDDFQVDENVQNTGHTKEVENCLNQEKAASAEGEENAIDLNWTMTTTDWERIDGIGHIVEREGSTKMYKCKYCPVSSREFIFAEKHYRNKHQDLTLERNLFTKIHTERLELMKTYEDISCDGTNETLARFEGQRIMERLNKYVSDLKDLTAILPPHMDYKKRTLLKTVGADIKCIRNLIKRLDESI